MAKEDYVVQHRVCGSSNVQSCHIELNCYKIVVLELPNEGYEVSIDDGDLEESNYDAVSEDAQDDFLWCNQCNTRIAESELMVIQKDVRVFSVKP